jgi:hypothetical protein
MENTTQSKEEIRLKLLDRCFDLGLPASSNDDINTLKMYLDIDSKLDDDCFDFQIETPRKTDKEVKSIILKLFSI